MNATSRSSGTSSSSRMHQGVLPVLLSDPLLTRLLLPIILPLALLLLAVKPYAASGDHRRYDQELEPVPERLIDCGSYENYDA